MSSPHTEPGGTDGVRAEKYSQCLETQSPFCSKGKTSEQIINPRVGSRGEGATSARLSEATVYKETEMGMNKNNSHHFSSSMGWVGQALP